MTSPNIVNRDLAVLHGRLIAIADQLNAAFGRAATEVEAKKFLDEIAAVNARVVAIGQRLFTQQTDAVARDAATITAALPELEEAIRRSDQLEVLVAGTTKFLRAIDVMIDPAKLAI